MTANTEAAPAVTTPEPKQRKFVRGTRQTQAIQAAIQRQNQIGNKDFVQNVLDRLTPEEQQHINQVGKMRVIEYYTLPGQQLDVLHRLFRRVITLNRDAFLEAAAAEYQKAVEKAKAAQEEAAAKEAATTTDGATPTTDTLTVPTDVVAAEP